MVDRHVADSGHSMDDNVVVTMMMILTPVHGHDGDDGIEQEDFN